MFPSGRMERMTEFKVASQKLKFWESLYNKYPQGRACGIFNLHALVMIRKQFKLFPFMCLLTTIRVSSQILDILLLPSHLRVRLLSPHNTHGSKIPLPITAF
jgi:hypothetical protein